jgi:hypothetical protein
MKFSSLAGDSKPETPKQNAISVAKAKAAVNRRSEFNYAVSTATVETAEHVYRRLTEETRNEFSLATFKRNVGAK